VAESGVPLAELASAAAELSARARTLIFVAVDGRPAGLLGVADPLRSDLQEILKAGKQAALLTHQRLRAGDGGPAVEAYLDMPTALAAADLVIARSGASSIAEIVVAGLPSILIPYPFAYANHQKLYADQLAARGAAIVCEESACTAESLAGLVRDLRSAPDRLARMAEAARAMSRPDAARKVAEVVLSVAQRP